MNNSLSILSIISKLSKFINFYNEICTMTKTVGDFEDISFISLAIMEKENIFLMILFLIIVIIIFLIYFFTKSYAKNNIITEVDDDEYQDIMNIKHPYTIAHEKHKSSMI